METVPVEEEFPTEPESGRLAVEKTVQVEEGFRAEEESDRVDVEEIEPVTEEFPTEEESDRYPRRQRIQPDRSVAGWLRRTRAEVEPLMRQKLASDDDERWVEAMNSEVDELGSHICWTVKVPGHRHVENVETSSCLQLNRSLYGLREASRICYQLLLEKLASFSPQKMRHTMGILESGWTPYLQGLMSLSL